MRLAARIMVIFEELSQRFADRWLWIARIGNLELHKIAESTLSKCQINVPPFNPMASVPVACEPSSELVAELHMATLNSFDRCTRVACVSPVFEFAALNLFICRVLPRW